MYVLHFILGACAFALSSCDAALPPALDITRLKSGEPDCDAALSALRQGLDTGQLWAQTMVDAGVRSPVGLLSQTSVQFGDFDGCLSLQPPVSPQYCLFDLAPGDSSNSSWSRFMWGVCVPAACSPQALRASLQTYMDEDGTGMSVEINPAACTTPDTASYGWSQPDLIFCSVLFLVVLVVVVCTVREVKSNDYDGVSPPGTVSQCLSARHGLHSLMRREQPILGVNLSALYGLHSFAFFFVVMGHRFGAHFFFMHLTNYRSVQHMFVGSWFSMWAGHMDLFVDIFFFMSAFLLGVLYYSELNKRFISPLMVYFYRLCRILPVYVVVVFFYATVLRHLGDGPLWNMFMDREQGNCQQNWWTNLLFINTYVNTENMCLLQSWYISCDFQLSVVATFLVFLLQKRPGPGATLVGLVFVASTVAPFLGTYLFNRPAMLLFYKDFWADPRQHDIFTSVYSQGHYRGTSYLVGLLAGVFVYRHKTESLSKAQSYLLELAGLLLALVVYWSGALFYDLNNPPDRLVSALYAASFHTVFGLGLSLLFVAWTLGKSTVLSTIFSWRGFVPLSKLSYCVYMIHNIPHFVWVASARTTVHFDPLELVSWSIADVVLSLVVSLMMFLTIETPARYLVKFLISGPPPKPGLPVTAQPQERYMIQDPFGLKKNTNLVFES